MKEKNGIQNDKNISLIDKGVGTNLFLMDYVKRKKMLKIHLKEL